jgi:hypothetical protein
MGLYRNDGAGWYRRDGTRINRGDVFDPTPGELRQRRHKLKKVDGKNEPTVAVESSPSSVEEPEEPTAYLDQYATGGGWYDIPGTGKVQGKAKALAALGVTDAEPEG